jgi:hypothetical protein
LNIERPTLNIEVVRRLMIDDFRMEQTRVLAVAVNNPPSPILCLTPESRQLATSLEKGPETPFTIHDLPFTIPAPLSTPLPAP